jgi:hypothetical protein
MKMRAALGVAAMVGMVFLASGCGAKKAEDMTPSVLRPDYRYMEALRYTKKGDISVSLENRAQIIATYLNPLAKKDQKEHHFFVRVYIENDFDEENRSGLFHPFYTLTLNGAEPKKIEKISYGEAVQMSMPFVKRWYRLYRVTFDPITSRRLSLRFAHRHDGEVVLDFENSE